MNKFAEYTPDNVLGWSEEDFAEVEEAMINACVLAQYPVAPCLIRNHNHNNNIIRRREIKEEVRAERIARLEAELKQLKEQEE